MSLLERFLGRPAGQAIMAAAEADHETDRYEQSRELQRQIDEIKAALEADGLRYAALEAAAHATYGEAEERLRVTLAAVLDLEAERRSVLGHHQHRIVVLTAQQIAKAPAQIVEFVGELDSARDALSRALSFSEDYNEITSHRTIRTNAASIERCRLAIQAARQAAIAMQLEALTAAEVGEQISALRASIPGLEEVSESFEPAPAA